MSEDSTRGLLRSILDTLDLGRPRLDLGLECALMVAWADGHLSHAEQDAIERAIAEGQLQDVDWPMVQRRAEILERGAPFFSEHRRELSKARWPREDRRMALRLAARVATADSKMQVEQRALLDSLTEDLGLEPADLADMLPRWGYEAAPDGAVGWLRSAYSDPELDAAPDLFDALAEASGDEVGVLLFKLEAPRDVASLHFEQAEIRQVSPRIEHAGAQLRIDAIIEGDDKEWWVRSLAFGEALHPRERILWPSLVASLAEHQRLVLARQGPLGPVDRSVVDALSGERFLDIELQLPSTAE